MKPQPSLTRANALIVMVFNKLNKSDYFSYDFLTQRKKLCLTPISGCVVPKFVEQMENIAQIDGIVDFNFEEKGGKSGHFIIVNINGRPKMCFTFENESISEEVLHKNTLIFINNYLITFSANRRHK